MELIPDKVNIPNELELLEYLVDVDRVDLDYNAKGKVCTWNHYDWFDFL